MSRQTVTNLCKVLGVSPNYSLAQLKAAYNKKAKETHPDKNPGIDEAEFVAVKEAYDILERRAKSAAAKAAHDAANAAREREHEQQREQEYERRKRQRTEDQSLPREWPKGATDDGGTSSDSDPDDGIDHQATNEGRAEEIWLGKDDEFIPVCQQPRPRRSLRSQPTRACRSDQRAHQCPQQRRQPARACRSGDQQPSDEDCSQETDSEDEDETEHEVIVISD